VRKARGNHLGYFPKTGYPLGYPEPALSRRRKREKRIIIWVH